MKQNPQMEAAAAAAVSFAIEKIGELLDEKLIEKLNFSTNIPFEAESLEGMLRWLLRFLKDVDKREGEHEIIQKVVSEVRNIASDAIVALERYEVKAESQREGGFKNVLRRNFIMHRKLRSQIRNITKKISADLAATMNRYHVIDMSLHAFPIRTIINEERTDFFDSHPEDFVGLEKEVETLANQLIKRDCHGGSYRLVSIYGIAGSGKTTLARKVYKHPELNHYFDRFAWVYASQQDQPKEVLQMILHQLMAKETHQLMPKETEEIEEREIVSDLCRQLFQIQNAKRCLVVLDGISSTNTWESIKDAFCSGDMFSQIMVTTRNKKVALHIDPNGFHYQPRLLDGNESWELLKKTASLSERDKDFEEIGKIEDLGKKMAKHCHGLPLAVVVLGRKLARIDLTVWERAYEEIVEDLRRELQEKLASSYSELPYRLKTCLLYFAPYPEDTYIDVLTLYQLWIAEGMILTLDRSGEDSLMEIAERYLNELVDTSMVQIQGDDFSVSRKFDSCRLRELTQNFCLKEGRKETSVEVMDFRGSSCETVPTYTAASRLVIYTNTGLDYVGSDKVAHAAHEKLGSLEFHNTSVARQLPPQITVSQNLLKQLKYLKSLVFESYKFGDHNNLEEVFNRLEHLRFLSFKDCDLDKLPSSVCCLPCLQTLDLRVQWGYPFKLTKDQWKTLMLRYLFFSDSSVEVVKGKLRLKGLSQLERIVNFQTDKMEVRDLLHLKNLNVFTAIVRDSKSLSLIVDGLKDVKMELRVRYCDFKNASDLLRKVLECPKLFSLEILGPLGLQLPMVQDAKGLSELVLVHSEINEDPMETLEKMPNLRRLVLGNKAYLGKEMRCRYNNFPSLKSLCLTELPNLENWRVHDGAMPCLLRLVIKSCTKLEVPDGLSFITTLKQLHTRSMSADFNKNVRELLLDLKECAFDPSEK